MNEPKDNIMQSASASEETKENVGSGGKFLGKMVIETSDTKGAQQIKNAHSRN